MSDSTTKRVWGEDGRISIAALDHRQSLNKLLDPVSPDSVPSTQVLDWKRKMVGLFQDEVSSVILDPKSAKELIDHKVNCAWMVSIEKTGYEGGDEARITELAQGVTVESLKESGADAVKLLLYLDPDNVELTYQQLTLARQVSAQCAANNITFLLEPLSYKIETTNPEEVIKIVDKVKEVEADIYKMEYGGSKEVCEYITNNLPSPWVLLSAGLEYQKYKSALLEACQAGASGFAAGRAIWQEMGSMQGSLRDQFLENVAVERVRELVALVQQYAKPVTKI